MEKRFTFAPTETDRQTETETETEAEMKRDRDKLVGVMLNGEEIHICPECEKVSPTLGGPRQPDNGLDIRVSGGPNYAFPFNHGDSPLESE